MFTDEARDSDMETLVEAYVQQEKIWHHNPKNLAMLLQAIGYNGGSPYHRNTSDIIMQFLEDNEEAVARLVEYVQESDQEEWRLELSTALKTDDVFQVQENDDDPDFRDLVRADTDEVLVSFLTEEEASAKADELNEEILSMTKCLDEGAHLYMESIRFVKDN